MGTRRRPETKPPPRLAHNVAWLGQLAQYGAFAATLAAVLAMLSLPGYSLVNLLVALWVTRAYWMAAGAIAVVYAAGRLWQRVALGPAPTEPQGRRLTGAARQADRGRAMTAWYMVGGFGIIAVLSFADRGPFAQAVTPLRRFLGVATPFAGFVLGCLALVLPLVILAKLPRAEGWPMVAAAQDMLRPVSAGRIKRRRNEGR